jgi:matrixin
MHAANRHVRMRPAPLSVCAAVVAALTAVLGAYETTGHTWPISQVSYFVNPQNRYVSNSAAIAAIQTAASAWSEQTNANIALVYAGTTGGSSLTLNNKNEVFFRDDGALGAETYWWWDGGGRLVDADILFHEGQTYFTGLSGCSGAGLYVEDIGTHEFGHVLGLDHSSVSTATMRPTTEFCSTLQVSLDPDDIAGIESSRWRSGPRIPRAASSCRGRTTRRRRTDSGSNAVRMARASR